MYKTNSAGNAAATGDRDRLRTEKHQHRGRRCRGTGRRVVGTATVGREDGVPVPVGRRRWKVSPGGWGSRRRKADHFRTLAPAPALLVPDRGEAVLAPLGQAQRALFVDRWYA